MGQKIRPDSLRLGIIGDWQSKWFPKNGYPKSLQEDEVIRAVIRERLTEAGIISIIIERPLDNSWKVTVKVGRPGLAIGRGGKGIEDLTKEIEAKLKALITKRVIRDIKITDKRKVPPVSVKMNIEEMKRNDVSAMYIAQLIAWDLEKRTPGRRVLKRHLDLMIQNREVKGAKIKLSGRIDGAEISRREMLSAKKLPLQTLRANIDYGTATAHNTYGTVGVKVWIYKGDVFEEKSKKLDN